MEEGDREPLEGAKELGVSGKYTRTGRHHPMGLGDVFQGGGAGGTPIWVRDVVDNPLHGQIPGGLSAQSRQVDYRDTAKAMGGWELGLPTSGDS